MNKTGKKIILVSLLVLIFNSSIPRLTNGRVLYSEYNPRLVQTDNQHLMVYTRVGTESNRTVSEEIFARPCYLTVTEFKTEETEEVLVTSSEFDAMNSTVRILEYDLLYYNGQAFLIFAAYEQEEQFTHFLLKYSDDEGYTWSEETIYLGNSTIERDEFVWFDAIIFDNQLYIAYSSDRDIPGRTIYDTHMIMFDRETFQNTTEITTSTTSFGPDFNLYTYNNRIYIVYSDINTRELVFSYSNDGFAVSTGMRITPPFSVDLSILAQPPIDPEEAKKLYPAVIRWDEGFLIIARDISNTTIKARQVNRYESFLWSIWIKDTSSPDTMITYNVSDSEFDTYYERKPSISMYEDTLLMAFERGPSSTQSRQTPEVDFFHSTDGSTWTGEYLGFSNWLINPATIFLAATVAVFVIALVTNFIRSRIKKKE